MKPLFTAAVLVAALSATGCRHAMRVTNLDQYRPEPTTPLQPPRTVGLRSPNIADPATRGFVAGIAEGLRRDASFDRVIYPFDSAIQKDVDVVFDVTVTPTYTGKGSNFFVNWPGFLIFAPAIWGYGYEASIDTAVSVWTADGQTRQLRIPTRFTFRQAEFDRTWTEIGWLEFGIIPLFGGLAFMSYDPDLTPEFVTKVAPDYGAYVAQRMRESLASQPPQPAKPTWSPASM